MTMSVKSGPAAQEIEDVGIAIREGRPLNPANNYRIRFANGDLEFKQVTVPDPIPLGRQILAAGGVKPNAGASLFAILASGDFEDVRLDEPFDLRGHGAERFIAFVTDRDYKATVNGAQIEWGKRIISGAVLYALAEPGADEAVFLEVPGGTDRLIEPEDLIDLDEPGIEHFITAPKPRSQIEIIVNARPRLVDGPDVTFEQIVQLAFPGAPEANVVFSMTYRHAKSKPNQGELGIGGVVTVKKGTTFNVTRTVQS